MLRNKILPIYFLVLLWLLCQVLCACGQKAPEVQFGHAEEEGVRGEDGQDNSQTETKEQSKEAEEKPPEICIYICGAVNQPGVYHLNGGARVYEAVSAAGGFTEDADETYVNQAAVIEDGAQIRIYTREEAQEKREQGEEIPQEEERPGNTLGDGKVNLNTATAEELQTLPGIGEVKASSIIEYRETHGRFTSIEELQEISGIKGKVFQKIADLITI